MTYRLILFIALCGSALAGTYSNVTSGLEFDGTTLVTTSGGVPSVPTGYETNLWAYFKAEEDSSATTAVDSVNGYNMPIYGGPAVSIAGKIGNAWDMDTFTWRRTTGTNYNFFGHDFSIRMWIKHDIGASFGSYILDNNAYDIQWQANRTVRWRIYPSVGNITVFSSAVPDDGNWHRIICWLATGDSIGIQVDDGAATTTALTSPMYDGGTDFIEFLATAGSNPQGIDEVAFWKDYCFTNASDLAKDWNSGSGVTYPLP